MKIVLYVILGIIALIGGFIAWFFTFFLQAPELPITPDMPESKKVEVIDNWFSSLQEEYKFNGVVLWAKEGKALLAKGYGYTNQNRDVKLTEHSSLRLASVSKQFTAAGIMLLKEKGTINYDDKVSAYIRDFPYQNVTIRNLLNQTSGIPDIYMELAESNKATIPILTNQIAVDLLIGEKRKAEFQPNEKQQYSNTNYIILARLIEVISGLSFEEYMKTALFEPLGMKNTRVWNLKSAESTFENKADDFKNFEGFPSEVKPSFIDGVAGDGAVFCSARDMLIWDGFWYENDLIQESNLQEAFIKPVLNNGDTSNYGFGWVITDHGMWHNGRWLGANTIIDRNTENKTCLVILDNSSNVFFKEILKQVKAIARDG